MQAKINVWLNRNSKQIYLLFLGILGILVGIIFIYSGVSNSVTPDTALYSGRYALQDEEEYKAFINIIASGNITIIDIEELSSQFPILVKYRIKAPLSIDFPYSKPVQTWGKGVSVAKNRMWIGLGALGIVAGIFLTLRFFHKLG